MATLTDTYDVPVLNHHVRYHAFITHCEADLGFAVDLLKQIELRHFRCVFAKRDFDVGATVVDNIANAIHSSRRTVLVISKASLKSEWCKYEMLLAIDDTNRHNRISFIPILRDDVTDDDLPHALRFVTYIHTGRDPDYLHKLLRALAAPDEDWEDHIPVGNVAHGLAWNYYFGYLKFLLPGMDKRIECFKHGETDSMKRRMCKKILLLYPASCQCRLRRLDEDPSGRITYTGEIELLKDRAGVVGRVYKNTVYSVVSQTGEKYYFAGEYVTCIRTMYEMEQSGMAGLKHDDTRLMCTKFLITIKNILDRDRRCTNMYRIIFYKDTEQSGKTVTLADHIVKAIQEELISEDIGSTNPPNHVKTCSRETISTTDSQIRPINHCPMETLSTAATNNMHHIRSNSKDETSRKPELPVYDNVRNGYYETPTDTLYNETVDRWVRQQSCDSGMSIENDRHGQTRTVQVGSELINIFKP